MPKLMGYSQRSSKREVYSDTGLLQDTRKISNKWSYFTIKEKKNKLSPKLAEIRIRKTKMEQMQSKPEKNIEKSTEQFFIFSKAVFF